MKLFLVRHGETVDNVAQLYAGHRDSALTIHGSLQAERLGLHFAGARVRFTKIFSSDLQRAYKTAEALRIGQGNINEDKKYATKLEVTQLVLLREQDFGSCDGKSFFARKNASKISSKEEYMSQHSKDPGFRDVESKEAMDARMDTFIRDHLLQLLPNESSDAESIVAVVSHGIILNHLWRGFLTLFPKRSVALVPGLGIGGDRKVGLQYLGGWSNTGYLELDIQRAPTSIDAVDVSDAVSPLSQSQGKNINLPGAQLKMAIKTVNGTEHLKSLKRTRGGVGSAKYDEGQKKLESFFKKTKVG